MTTGKSGQRRLTIGACIVLALLLTAVPTLIFALRALQSGVSWQQQWTRLWGGTGPQVGDPLQTAAAEGAEVPLLAEPRAMGQPAGSAPQISFLRIADLNQDGRADVLVCDALARRIGWIEQLPSGMFREHVLPHELPGPAHIEAADVDNDGDLDLLVACMGALPPTNEHIGSVVVLENDGELRFTPRVLLEEVARVTDVRAADLDHDGDLDLVVGQFGYDDGEIRWLEQREPWTFQSHFLLRLSGTIHTPLGDMDGDGDLDIVALVSQEWEEVYLFRNEGGGRFSTTLLYGSTNEDFGSSGIELADLDGDGDLDILYTSGDAFDYLPPRPRPWHGVQWLENRGSAGFTFQRLAAIPGASVARAADLDGDGDLDIAVSSAYTYWERPGADSLVWLENISAQAGGPASKQPLQFVRRPLAGRPTHLIAMDVGDLNGDMLPDIVAGGMHIYPPYEHIGRVTYWENEGREAAR